MQMANSGKHSRTACNESNRALLYLFLHLVLLFSEATTFFFFFFYPPADHFYFCGLDMYKYSASSTFSHLISFKSCSWCLVVIADELTPTIPLLPSSLQLINIVSPIAVSSLPPPCPLSNLLHPCSVSSIGCFLLTPSPHHHLPLHLGQLYLWFSNAPRWWYLYSLV